ncbi:arf-GAP domain and FG repeat-containing protein 1a isoform X9 [Denticeps clupeoides]|uniref:arf-GAP domain and FG repeat-containing protein 1a isoform X9 n=1 Tax=Denticeps clupeoides TaxID=299321 RepID=UPI0010A59485|nr:arf-GAP domain and FG repeat-containing protein 1 isoform X9 [Denticeps clupeoides]
MAASAKRKQEEKHLKLLREMASSPPNRKCFDCDQRGPTYADMTVGSFVCTSCSGVLRGLNPPHRVKSISMTTFTQQEIDFLQKHGNEVCKQIWLGLYDDRTSAVPDFREPQKVKEFLQEKYEKKRWFVPPEQAKVVASVHASISGSSASSTSSTPEVRPLKALLGDSAPVLHFNKATPSQSPVSSRAQQMNQQFQEKKFDLLSDLGGDIFAALPTQTSNSVSASFANFAHFNSHPAQNTNANTDFANFDAFENSAAAAPAQLSSAPPSGSTSGLANANFANFDNFPKSCSADFGTLGSLSGGGAKSAADSAAFAADRYAALADLDNIFSSTKTEQGGSGPSGVSSAPLSASVGPPHVKTGGLGGDRYAALAALDNVFSSSAPPTSGFSTISSAQGTVFGAVTGVSPAQPQQSLPSMQQGFAGSSTNPFVATAAAPTSNPFQSNGRGAAVAAAASFGPGSMSMPAGFGSTTAYNLPSSYSGNFHQPFPGQAFPQTQAYPEQPNGFAAFAQPKPMVTPFGQSMATPVASNPFLAGAPAGPYPTASSSTNPFL